MKTPDKKFKVAIKLIGIYRTTLLAKNRIDAEREAIVEAYEMTTQFALIDSIKSEQISK